MTSHDFGQHGKRTHSDWDLKLAAILFIGTCATMSLILPNWRSPLENGSEVEAAPVPPLVLAAPMPSAAAMARPAPPPPAQQDAALAAYRAGMDQLRKHHYDEAAGEFKTALEKSADLTEAYIGLGDAFIHTKDYGAAETNARHALSKLKLLRVGQAPDPALKRELAYAHQVLGVALLHLAQEALDHHQLTTGRMQALEAGSHCSLATVFDSGDEVARDCAKQASTLTSPE